MDEAFPEQQRSARRRLGPAKAYPHSLSPYFRTTLDCDRPEMLPLAEEQRPIGRTAKSSRLVEDRLENRSEVTGRRVDDTEHLGCRGLLVEGLARLGDEARVLHRDHRLGREILQQRDLLLRKPAQI